MSLFQRSVDGMGFGLRGKLKTRDPPTMPLNDDDIKEIDEAFTLFDADKTGTVDYHELKVAMRALGFAVKKADVLRLVRDVDVHDTGNITRDQFVSILKQQYSQRDPEEEMKKAFRLFDADASGNISVKNLRLISKELGEDIGDDELQAMIDEFDKDADGLINESEFMSIMQQSSNY